MRQSLKLFILVLVIFLSSCSSGINVNEREVYWKEKLEEFHPIGKTGTEIFEWGVKNKIPQKSFPYEEGVILETLEDNSFVCSHWDIYLSIVFNSNNVIESYSISSSGTCL